MFGPKIVATRGSYEDKALESRFLTEEMARGSCAPTFPSICPTALKKKRANFRNKLLLYRFHRRHEVKLDQSLVDPSDIPLRFLPHRAQL